MIRESGKALCRGLLCCVIFAAAPVLIAETLYLSRTVYTEGRAVLDDLLLRSADNPLLGTTIVPISPDEGAVYLSQQGISQLLPDNSGASLVGNGVWIVDRSFDRENRPALIELLQKIEKTVRDPRLGFRIDGYRLHSMLQGYEDPLSIRPDYLSMAASEPEVRVGAGSRIVISILRRGLIITAEGKTNRSASVGETVPVTLSATRRRLEVQLTGPAEGELRL